MRAVPHHVAPGQDVTALEFKFGLIDMRGAATCGIAHADPSPPGRRVAAPVRHILAWTSPCAGRTGRPATGAAIRQERSALPVASSTLAWTEKTSIRRVRVRSRSTCCFGAASSRSPPACRACFRARTSAAKPLQSMKSRPARSTTISRSRAAAAVSAAATLAASTGQARRATRRPPDRRIRGYPHPR